MPKCPRCDWNGDFIEVTNTVEKQCPNCGFQGNIDTTSYEDMTKDQLTEVVESRGLEIPAKATKQDLIDLLQNP